QPDPCADRKIFQLGEPLEAQELLSEILRRQADEWRVRQAHLRCLRRWLSGRHELAKRDYGARCRANEELTPTEIAGPESIHRLAPSPFACWPGDAAYLARADSSSCRNPRMASASTRVAFGSALQQM